MPRHRRDRIDWTPLILGDGFPEHAIHDTPYPQMAYIPLTMPRDWCNHDSLAQRMMPDLMSFCDPVGPNARLTR
jgi:hypothetical protein